MKNSIVFKAVLGLFIGVMIGLSISGCSSTEETISNEDVTDGDGEVTEVTEDRKDDEEESLTISDEEFKKAISTNLTDNAYASYFNSIKGEIIEFDGCINLMELREGYDTRYELILSYGDFSEESVTGPYMKINDIAYNDKLSSNVIGATANVRVTARVDKYDLDKSYLILEPIFVEAR